MRALVVLVLGLWAAPAAAAPCLPAAVFEETCLVVTTSTAGDDVITCFHSRCASGVVKTCLVVEPATGAVTALAKPPAALEPDDDEPNDEPNVLEAAAFERCGRKCAALRERLALRDELTAAIDPTGKLLFEIEHGDPTRGTTWSLVTGKRIARFVMDDFDGPPPPTDFARVRFVGRHVFVGVPDEDYTLTYDVYDGSMGMLFQQRHLGRGLVIHNDGFGRLDLLDYAQRRHPRVAVRRVKPSKPGASPLEMHTTQIADRTVVVVEDPPITLLVDGRKRTIGKPRPLPRCAN